MKVCEYAGRTIEYNNGKFYTLEHGEIAVEDTTEQGIKDKIDKADKQSFKPMAAFDSSLRHIRITSLNLERSYHPEYWWTVDRPDRKGKAMGLRGKENIHQGIRFTAYKDTPENESLILQIGQLYDERDKLDAEIKARTERLSMLTLDDLKASLKPKEDPPAPAVGAEPGA